MSIFDNPPTQVVDSDNIAAIEAMRAMNRAFKEAERACNQISRVTTRVGRSNLDAELGAEAGDFETKYNLVMNFANGHPGCNAGALPS